MWDDEIEGTKGLEELEFIMGVCYEQKYKTYDG